MNSKSVRLSGCLLATVLILATAPAVADQASLTSELPRVSGVSEALLTDSKGEQIVIDSPHGDGELLIAHMVSPQPVQPPDESWRIIDLQLDTELGYYSMVFAKVVADQALEPSQYVFSQSRGRGRMAVGIARIAGSDLEDPVETVVGTVSGEVVSDVYAAPGVSVVAPSTLVVHFWGTGGGVDYLAPSEELTPWWAFGSKMKGRPSSTMASTNADAGPVPESLADGPMSATVRSGHTVAVRAEGQPAPPGPEPDPDDPPDPDPDVPPDPDPVPGPGELASKSLVAFGPVPIGTSSDLEVTLTNVGGTSVVVTDAVVTGDPAFALTTSDLPAELAPGEWKSLGLRFTPSIAAHVEGEVEISSAASDTTHRVRLTGIGGSVGPGEPGSSTLVFSAAPSGCGTGCAEQSVLWITDDGGVSTDQLTFPTGSSDRSPRWSPDGSSIAFTRTANGTGQAEIYLLELSNDGMTTERKVTATSDENGGVGCARDLMIPVWSPSGSRIAFTCAAGYGRSTVQVVATSGGQQYRLSSSNMLSEASPSWSPDGGKLAFARISALLQYGSPGRETIWTVPVTAGDFGEATKVVSDASAASQPAWSPLGDRIAYVSKDELLLRVSLKTVTTTGGIATHYSISGDAGMDLYSLAWAPDGSAVAFSAGDALNVSKLMVASLVNGTTVQLSGEELLAFGPTWAPNSSKVFFDLYNSAGGTATAQLVSVSPSSGITSVLTPPSLFAFDSNRKPLP